MSSSCIGIVAPFSTIHPVAVAHDLICSYRSSTRRSQSSTRATTSSPVRPGSITSSIGSLWLMLFLHTSVVDVRSASPDRASCVLHTRLAWIKPLLLVGSRSLAGMKPASSYDHIPTTHTPFPPSRPSTSPYPPPTASPSPKTASPPVHKSTSRSSGSNPFPTCIDPRRTHPPPATPAPRYRRTGIQPKTSCTPR